jgi:hypothetical protein
MNDQLDPESMLAIAIEEARLGLAEGGIRLVQPV